MPSTTFLPFPAHDGGQIGRAPPPPRNRRLPEWGHSWAQVHGSSLGQRRKLLQLGQRNTRLTLIYIMRPIAATSPPANTVLALEEQLR